jgi:hypothetical protein
MLYNRLEALRYGGGLRFQKATWETVRAYLRYMTAGGVPGEMFDSEEGNLRVFLDRTHNVLRIYGFVERAWPGTASLNRETPLELELGKPPAGTPFSDDVRILRGLARNRPAPFEFSDLVRGRLREEDHMHSCIVDPADGSLWALDLKGSPPALTSVALPGGDRFVRLEPLYDRRIREVGRRWSIGSDAVVHGEKGTYAWNGVTFVEFQPSAIYALKPTSRARSGPRGRHGDGSFRDENRIRASGGPHPLRRLQASECARAITRPRLVTRLRRARGPVPSHHLRRRASPSGIEPDPRSAAREGGGCSSSSASSSVSPARCGHRDGSGEGTAPSALAILASSSAGAVAFAKLFKARRHEPVVEPKAACGASSDRASEPERGRPARTLPPRSRRASPGRRA